MNFIYFIQDNALLLGIGVVVVILFLITLSSVFRKGEKTLVIEVSKPVEGTSTYVSSEIAGTVITEEVIEEVQPKIVPNKPVNPFTEAKDWWKSLDIKNKRLYAFDAQYGDRKLSTLKNSELLEIYNIFTENNQITTK